MYVYVSNTHIRGVYVFRICSQFCSRRIMSLSDHGHLSLGQRFSGNQRFNGKPKLGPETRFGRAVRAYRARAWRLRRRTANRRCLAGTTTSRTRFLLPLLLLLLRLLLLFLPLLLQRVLVNLFLPLILSLLVSLDPTPPTFKELRDALQECFGDDQRRPNRKALGVPAGRPSEGLKRMRTM